jgi:hypothetical protein
MPSTQQPELICFQTLLMRLKIRWKQRLTTVRPTKIFVFVGFQKTLHHAGFFVSASLEILAEIFLLN